MALPALPSPMIPENVAIDFVDIDDKILIGKSNENELTYFVRHSLSGYDTTWYKLDFINFCAKETEWLFPRRQTDRF